MADEKPEEATYFSGEQHAWHKEIAIERALDVYFKAKEWDEGVLASSGRMDFYPDGSEVFLMGDQELVRFGRPTTFVVIEGDRVTCTFRQEITPLYHD